MNRNINSSYAQVLKNAPRREGVNIERVPKNNENVKNIGQKEVNSSLPPIVLPQNVSIVMNGDNSTPNGMNLNQEEANSHGNNNNTVTPNILQYFMDQSSQMMELISLMRSQAPLQRTYVDSLKLTHKPPQWGSLSDGAMDIYLDSLDAFFSTNAPNASSIEKAKYGASFFLGNAQQHYSKKLKKYIDEGLPDPWKVMKEAMLGIYQRADELESAVTKLLHLSEEQERIDNYIIKFNTLASKLPDNAQEFRELILCVLFRNGLRTRVSELVLVDPSGERHKSLGTLQTHAKHAADSVNGRKDKTSDTLTQQNPKKRFGTRVETKPPEKKMKAPPSYQERKATNKCLICGQIGHFKGACPKGPNFDPNYRPIVKKPLN